MKWVLQDNIYDEQGYEGLVRAIDACGESKTIVKCIPFDGGLLPVEGEIPADWADAIVMGSYTLAKEAKRRNWHPGSFLRNLDFTIQRRYWGNLMLNNDAEVIAFGDIPPQVEPFFMRPVHDTKAFTGAVFDWPFYEKWRDGVSLLLDRLNQEEYEKAQLRLDTPVMLCKKKEIYTETRFWVIEGKPRTWSQYKTGTLKGYRDPSYTNQHLIDAANALAQLWSPNEAYCLDLAETPDGIRIVEVNNLNSAGMYKGDMFKVVEALENWAECPNGLLW